MIHNHSRIPFQPQREMKLCVGRYMGAAGDKESEWIKPVSEGQMFHDLTCDLKFYIVTQSQYVHIK